MKPSWPALPDQAGIDCEAFAADVIFGYAARRRHLDQPA
ncbi:MAG: hypothetical protein K0R27_4800 [Xanthobacteraceae bacterium]|jgi:hypothetical protein|nr:hypothetical protein [Xanthobacteraceae bacterium]